VIVEEELVSSEGRQGVLDRSKIELSIYSGHNYTIDLESPTDSIIYMLFSLQQM
jgi:hypothetical protein